MLKRSDLNSYQEEMVNFILEKKKVALFLGMGLGKTATSLTAARELIDDFHITRVLVISTLRVCNTVWEQEARKWEHLNILNVKIATGAVKKRKRALEEYSDITVINFENVKWLCDYYDKDWPFDMIIVDESSKFKSHSSKRFKAIRQKLKYVKSVVLLTGTPAPEGITDLWSQIYLIDNGERLGRTISAFRNRFFNSNNYMGFTEYKIKKGADDEVKELIKDVAVSLSAEDLEGSLSPGRDYHLEYVELPKSSHVMLKELKSDFITSLEDGTDITVGGAAAIAGKMLQICNGAVYDENKVTHEIHDEKLKALRDLLDDNPNENFFVAYNFKSDLKRLVKAFPEAVVLSPSGVEIEDWNKGKIRMLLVHPQSAGHGLNAQFGGSIILWFGLNWSLELVQQLNARLDRPGQTKLVRIIYLVAKGGIDESICEAIKLKAKNQKDIINHLRYK